MTIHEKAADETIKTANDNSHGHDQDTCVVKPGDPIPWSWGLEIITGKYYSQFDIIYRGIRDSGAGIFADLASLIGNYVEVTE